MLEATATNLGGPSEVMFSSFVSIFAASEFTPQTRHLSRSPHPFTPCEDVNDDSKVKVWAKTCVPTKLWSFGVAGLGQWRVWMGSECKQLKAWKAGPWEVAVLGLLLDSSFRRWPDCHVPRGSSYLHPLCSPRQYDKCDGFDQQAEL